jgi:hypothetical protein
MAEKRKPCAVFLLRIEGIKLKDPKKIMKSQKIELFDSSLWGKSNGIRGARKFRMRVNGKWFNGKRSDMLFLDKWNVRDLIWRSIHL